MGYLSQKLRDTIDLRLLINDIDYVFPGAPNEASDDIKNTQIVKAMSSFRIAKGTALQKMFAEDFAGWTEKEFNRCNYLILRALRSLLTE